MPSAALVLAGAAGAVVYTLLALLLFWLIRRLALSILLHGREVQAQYRIRKTITYVNFLIAFLVIGRIWFAGFEALTTYLGLLSAGLAGACAGFLPHNFHPARLFMGDSGSMLIGLVLSASAVTLYGQFSGAEITQGGAGSQASQLFQRSSISSPVWRSTGRRTPR